MFKTYVSNRPALSQHLQSISWSTLWTLSRHDCSLQTIKGFTQIIRPMPSIDLSFAAYTKELAALSWPPSHLVSSTLPCNKVLLTHIAKQEHSSPPTKAPSLYSVIRPYQPQYRTQSPPQLESSYHASSLLQPKCSNKMLRWYLGPKAPLAPTRSSMAMPPFLH
jgi:hypothetical protein